MSVQSFFPVYQLDAELFLYNTFFIMDIFDLLLALGKSQGIAAVVSSHPLGSVNVCDNFHGDPSDKQGITNLKRAWLKIPFN